MNEFKFSNRENRMTSFDHLQVSLSLTLSKTVFAYTKWMHKHTAFLQVLKIINGFGKWISNV